MALPVFHIQISCEEEGEDGEQGGHPQEGQERTSDSVESLIEQG